MHLKVIFERTTWEPNAFVQRNGEKKLKSFNRFG